MAKKPKQEGRPVINGGAVIIDDGAGKIVSARNQSPALVDPALRVETINSSADGIDKDQKYAIVAIKPEHVIVEVEGKTIRFAASLVHAFEVGSGSEYVKGTISPSSVYLEVKSKFYKDSNKTIYALDKPSPIGRVKLDLKNGYFDLRGRARLSIKELE